MPPVKLTKDLVSVGKRLAADDNLHSALIVSEAAIKMFNIATLLSTAIDILDEELMPQIGSLAIQDFARLNEFFINARQIKKELEDD